MTVRDIEFRRLKPAALLSLQQRSLAGACLAHVLHDGYTDQLYVLLPIWQAQFGLSYAGLAVVRALYYGAMSGLQVPGNRLIGRWLPRTALVLATVVAALGYFIMALPGGFAGLCVGLLVAGIGSSVQHPRASLLVSGTYGASSRGPLSIYNFSGDLGKSIFPATVALLLTVMAWRPAVGLMGFVGFVAAFGLWSIVPPEPFTAPLPAAHITKARGRAGFNLLMVIGALDTSTRMGYLLFLPFLLNAKGGSETTIGFGLASLFIGGAFGKATCGWLGQRLGVVWTVIATESATALLIMATVAVPLHVLMLVLPFLGVVLNGTSSVLYGTVPELAPKNDTGRAFAMFYTGVIGASGLAPIAYGVIADHSSQTIGIAASALTALLIVPLIFGLCPDLKD